MTQSRKGSLIEAIINVLIGFGINFTANMLIFPLFGWHISARDNLVLGGRLYLHLDRAQLLYQALV